MLLYVTLPSALHLSTFHLFAHRITIHTPLHYNNPATVGRLEVFPVPLSLSSLAGVTENHGKLKWYIPPPGLVRPPSHSQG